MYFKRPRSLPTQNPSCRSSTEYTYPVKFAILLSLLPYIGYCHALTNNNVRIRTFSSTEALYSRPHRTPKQDPISLIHSNKYTPTCDAKGTNVFIKYTEIMLLAKKDGDTDDIDGTNDDSDESPRAKKDRSIFDRVGKLGSKVVSSVRGEKEGKKKGWFRRSGNANKNGGEEEGGKITAEEQQRKSGKGSSKPRAANPFGQQRFSDPFTSEVALSTELNRQKALDNYISGDSDETPEEFLPPEPPKDGSLGIDAALNTVDDSLAFIRNQLGQIRVNANDEKNSMFLTPKQEEMKLNKLRRDLERRRKEIMLEEQRRKKEKAAQDAAKVKKVREAAAQAKKEREKRIADERLRKEREERQKTLLKISKGDDVQMITSKSEDEKPEKEKGRKTNALASAAEGAMGSVQSAFSNVWQTVVSKTKDEDEWITVCPKTKVSPGEVYPVVAGGLDLLIIGSKDGTKIHCISNSCSHLGTPLETGMIERRPCPKRSSTSAPSNSLSTDDNTKQSLNDGTEDCIVCPLHRTAFSLDTGEVRGEWCPYPPLLGRVMGNVKAKNNLTTFKMRTRGKNIEIKISSSISDEPE